MKITLNWRLSESSKLYQMEIWPRPQWVILMSYSNSWIYFNKQTLSKLEYCHKYNESVYDSFSKQQICIYMEIWRIKEKKKTGSCMYIYKISKKLLPTSHSNIDLAIMPVVLKNHKNSYLKHFNDLWYL